MNENFSELLKILTLTNIQFVESHEKVLQNLQLVDGKEVQIKTEQRFLKDDPEVRSDVVLFRPKYIFTFFSEEQAYFMAEYVLFVSFTTNNISRFKEFFNQEEVKDLFLRKQMNRTLWTILRGTVMDAFNRHSLKPIPLPWII